MERTCKDMESETHRVYLEHDEDFNPAVEDVWEASYRKKFPSAHCSLLHSTNHDLSLFLSVCASSSSSSSFF